MAGSTAAAGCLHCGTSIPDGMSGAFCCAGCEVVHDLLRSQGLERFYALAGDEVKPASEVAAERSPEARGRAWLEPLLTRAEEESNDVASLELDVQGIHCTACVWLMEELFRRSDGGVQVEVNPALGKVRLDWRRGTFDVPRYLGAVESFGYRFGPSRKRSDPRSSELSVRLGVSAALTMNVMILSVSFYFGLAPQDGRLFTLFSVLSAVLSGAVVLVGGWPFFRSALQSARRGVLHLDLPIAVGIVLVFVTSLLRARGGRADLAYFDTLDTFVTLMLTGRWLQQRVIDRNRRFLLEDDGAEGLFVRRVDDGAVRSVPVASIRAGERLLISPGDLVPVASALMDDAAELSTAWITGESRPSSKRAGEILPAGACNESRRAILVVAAEDFADSRLLRLLRAPPAGGEGVSGSRFWSVLSRGWVLGVATVAAIGVLLWWPSGSEHALEIAAALLVVTCPCAIGIATPLAYELVQLRLRRQGVFIRSADLLDRLPQVRKVVFDKTGTLTLGKLQLKEPGALAALSIEARDAAYEMASRSSHPASRCLQEALAPFGPRFTPGADVVEHPGQGMELRGDGHLWRLGSPAFAGGETCSDGAVVVLSRNGVQVGAFALREAMRHDARSELARLQQDGVEVWLVSGDAEDRVLAAARELAIPPERALYRQSPEDKAAAVARIDAGARDTLFLGDGVNDALAFAEAACAGTPATDRPLMPSRADFFLLGEGLQGLRSAYGFAKNLRVVVRRALAVSLAYNVIAIMVCLAGWMTPLRAAIAMPVSSLSIVLFTVASLSGARVADGRRRSTARVDRAPAEVPA